MSRHSHKEFATGEPIEFDAFEVRAASTPDRKPRRFTRSVDPRSGPPRVTWLCLGLLGLLMLLLGR